MLYFFLFSTSRIFIFSSIWRSATGRNCYSYFTDCKTKALQSSTTVMSNCLFSKEDETERKWQLHIYEAGWFPFSEGKGEPSCLPWPDSEKTIWNVASSNQQSLDVQESRVKTQKNHPPPQGLLWLCQGKLHSTGSVRHVISKHYKHHFICTMMVIIITFLSIPMIY